MRSVFNYLGVKLRSGETAKEGQAEEEMLPLMVETFAWAFIFVDGILFLGMINPQNSPMHENVTIMFAAITGCRILQLAVAKFMLEAFVEDNDASNDAKMGWNNAASTIHPKKFGTQVTLLFTYVASVGLLLIALYNYMNANDLLATLAKNTSTSAYTIEIMFMFTVGVAPEIVRSIQLAYFCLYDTSASSILLSTEFLFLWNWVFRMALALVALFYVPAHLKDQNDAIMNFIGTVALNPA